MIAGWPASFAPDLRQLGDTDCERLGDGFLAQPVNTVTSLAYVVIGVVSIVGAGRCVPYQSVSRLYGLALVATGLGSVAFHGPQPVGARWLHDVPIALALLTIALHDRRLLRGGADGILAPFLVIGALIAAAALVPDAASVVTGILVVSVVVAEVVIVRRGVRPMAARRQRRGYTAIGLSAAVGVVLWVTGRTDAALCDPDGLVQAHGLWHLASAVVFGAWWWLALAGPVEVADGAVPAASARRP